MDVIGDSFAKQCRYVPLCVFRCQSESLESLINALSMLSNIPIIKSMSLIMLIYESQNINLSCPTNIVVSDSVHYS